LFLLYKYTVIITLLLVCFISALLTSILFKDNLLDLIFTRLDLLFTSVLKLK